MKILPICLSTWARSDSNLRIRACFLYNCQIWNKHVLENIKKNNMGTYNLLSLMTWLYSFFNKSCCSFKRWNSSSQSFGRLGALLFARAAEDMMLLYLFKSAKTCTQNNLRRWIWNFKFAFCWSLLNDFIPIHINRLWRLY